MLNVIRKPLVSEKNSLLAEKGIYAFDVGIDSTKTEIKKAIEKAFKVKVSTVRTIVGRGRAKQTKAGRGKIRYSKKALVRLAPGEKISLFEGA
jgi:large subunit ribosomal protein L23